MCVIKVALYEPTYTDEIIFNEDAQFNRDNCFAHFVLLKKKLEEKNMECHTAQYYQEKSICPDVVIYIDTLDLDPRLDKKNNYLLLCESVVIKPKLWNLKAHQAFKHIFTWHDPFVNDDRYIWSYHFSGLANSLIWSDQKNKKLCTLINANKFSNHPLELYTARKNIIEWFEKNHPNDFDLYGFGWDKRRFSRWPWRILNRTPYLNYRLAKHYRCYRGTIESKYMTLNQYRFCICFENAKEIEGYITEKILDAFMAGCVPVYWGAPNIRDYIPEHCFIDYTKFKDNAAMYDFLKNMPDELYQKYLDAIKKFILSDAAEKFKPEYFAKTIVKTITQDMESFVKMN